MKRILYILFIFAGYQDLQSQIVPGYQGKKTIISYHMNVSPAFERPTYLNRVRNTTFYPKAESSVALPFNFTHGVSFERVMGRKFSFDLDYNIAASKEYINFTQTYIDEKTQAQIIVPFNDIKVNVYAHYFTANAMFYGSNSLAPFGKYFKLSFGHCVMLTKFPEDSYDSEPITRSSITRVYTADTKKASYVQSARHIGMGLGSNRIYHNKWVVSKGVNFSLLFKPDYTFTEENNVYDKMFRRLRAHDLLTIFVKVGYLL